MLNRYRTYEDEESAEINMLAANNDGHWVDERGNNRNLSVIVDGPEANEWTVMSLASAIANDFLYRWAV